jgi:hypothetical protein
VLVAVLGASARGVADFHAAWLVTVIAALEGGATLAALPAHARAPAATRAPAEVSA